MNRLEFTTPLGDVWMWGELTGRPILLLIMGALADDDMLAHWTPLLPDVDVLRTHQPGNHSPDLIVPSVGVHAAALSSALDQAAPAQPLGIVGLSVGALTALGVRYAGLRQMLLVEPPLFTDHLWHLAGALGDTLSAAQAEMAWQVFGIRSGRVEEARDYSSSLQALRVPAEVLVGDIPILPEREMAKAPSFVDERARALLDAHPMVGVRTLKGVGHNVGAQAPFELFAAFQRLSAALNA